MLFIKNRPAPPLSFQEGVFLWILLVGHNRLSLAPSHMSRVDSWENKTSQWIPQPQWIPWLTWWTGRANTVWTPLWPSKRREAWLVQPNGQGFRGSKARKSWNTVSILLGGVPLHVTVGKQLFEQACYSPSSSTVTIMGYSIIYIYIFIWMSFFLLFK